MPTGVSNLSVSALWHRAYNLIYNEWFRDENLQNAVPVLKNDGPDPVTNYKLLRRGKRHDYFTSCLPWPQKGPGVEIPLGGSAPIVGSAKVAVFGDGKSLGIADGTTRYGLTGTGQPYLGLVASNFGANYGTLAPYSGQGITTVDRKAYGVTTDPSLSGLTGTLSNPSGLSADLSHSTPVLLMLSVRRFNCRSSMNVTPVAVLAIPRLS